MKKDEFEKQIKSPQWQKRRLEIMQIDNFTCQMCGDKESTLNVHHIHYSDDRNYWEYDDWELITLCERCHESEHGNNETISNQIKQLKSRGYLNCEIILLLEHIDIQAYLGREYCISDIAGEDAGECLGIDMKSLIKRRTITKKQFYKKQKKEMTKKYNDKPF